MRLGRFRKRIWFGQDSQSWPVLLLIMAALMPAFSLLWLMNSAVRNERLAERERLSQAYRGHLALARARLDAWWTDALTRIDGRATNSPPLAFAQAVESGVVDSVVFFDGTGRPVYPNRPKGIPIALERPAEWAEANQFEHVRKDFAAAAEKYAALAGSTNAPLAARALQAQVRCLVRSGRKEAALDIISQKSRAPEFARAADSEGRLIVANAELLALELIGDSSLALYKSITQSLQERLLDYGNPVMASPQRRFLMKALRRLSPAMIVPTLDAEDLAARYLEGEAHETKTDQFSPSSIAGVWQIATSNHAVALIASARLASNFQASLHGGLALPEALVTLIPPGAQTEGALVTIPAGRYFVGWQLALSLKNLRPLDSISTYRTALYLWIGILALLAMVLFAGLAIRLSRRHLMLARLKTDLAATVSHELKTPLSAMRLLVDTLLQSETFNERTVREYLALIAQENDRLHRLIHNFLCFSRLERNKWDFQFTPLRASEVTENVANVVRPRFQAANCRFEVDVEPGLPLIRADSDALSSALLNLLDNAYKYSGETKEILLQARANNGEVILSVKDNGIGIAPDEARKIFRPFYQSDQRLSRSNGGGFGLGLSIVQQIVTAHGGRARVQSQPGQGSTFSITLPGFVRN